jgi:hypothetical protein
VEAEVAEVFFTVLYAALADGTSPADAFRRAQTVTRQQHAGYRDWGAFTYLGA